VVLQKASFDGLNVSAEVYELVTRARSLLAIYGIREGSTAFCKLNETIAGCAAAMNRTPIVDSSSSIQDDLNDILEQIGKKHRSWLVDLWKRFKIRQEPIIDSEGRIVAEPLFWFEHDGELYACFGADDSPRDKQIGFETNSILLLTAGTELTK
jgi:hypothetical protein